MAYDYTALNGSADKARAAEDQIKADLQAVGRGFRAMIRVGSNLSAIKSGMPHGEWEKWIDQALDMSARNARRYMQVAKKFREVSTESFTEEVLALLVPSDVPEKAVHEVAKKGAEDKPKEAKKIVDKHKTPKKKSAPVNRIAKHLTGDGPVEFASEPTVTVEQKPFTAEPAANEPVQELTSENIQKAFDARKEESARKQVQDEVLQALVECKQQSEDPSEYAFDQAMEIIKQGIEIVKQLSPEYHARAHAMINQMLPMPKTGADELSPVGKSEAVQVTAQSRSCLETEWSAWKAPASVAAQESLVEPCELLPFDPLDIKLPEKLDHKRFKDAWSKWVRHNQNMNMPLDELAAEAQLKNLARRSLDSAVAAIETAIADRSTTLPKSKESSQSAFKAPTPEEVDEYVDTLEDTAKFTGQEFCDYYAKCGWKIKGQKMADWKAAVRTWMKNERSSDAGGGARVSPKPSNQSGTGGTAAVGGAYTKWKPTRPIPQ